VSLATYSHAFAFLAYAALAASLLRGGWLQPGRAWAHKSFLVAVAASAAWALAGFIAQLSASVAWALVAALLDLARYAAWFAFALALLARRGRSALTSGLFVALPFAVVAGLAAMLLFAAAQGDGTQQAWLRNLPLASLALPVVGLVLTEQVFRSASADARWHTKPLCLGLAAIFLFDVYLHSHVLLFGRFDADALMVRGIAHGLAAVLLYVATQRSANWAGGLHMSRNAAFHTATLTLIGAYLLLLSGIGYYVRNLGGDWGSALQVVAVVVGLVALATLLFSGTLRAKLRVFVGKNFFRYRYDYRVEWLRLTSRLVAADSPAEVGVLAVRGLAELLHSPSGALWYRRPDGQAFVQVARWKGARSDESEPADSAFSRHIGANEWLVDLEECRAHPERYEGVGVPPWLLAHANGWLAVPLVVANQLTGFVVIDRAHAAQQINWEVRDLLKTAARQVASYLALMHSTDALLEARKFDAFNKMSAFVVHDLKNIVAQLSLMMQNARRLRDNPEFQEDMLATVENSLDKMRRLMLQLRSGETPMQAAAGVALPPLVERIGAAAQARGRAVAIEIAEPVLTRGHEDRVERVLGHMVDNALDATAENSGTVSVALAREGSHAKVTITDTGVGMTEEFVRSRLFRPFNSTKTHGMGIGSYESWQYIQEIGGSLAVDSQPGRGTVITVLLPLLETGTERTLYSAP
jgi:putative PEP-CTERM system histidine kinase